MPRRLTPFISQEYYHLFNRGIYRRPIFSKKRDASIFAQLVLYYTQSKPPIKYSYYRANPDKYHIDFSQRLVTIISYCYMPTHFHISVRQEEDRGIQTFMQRVLNSFSHYYQTKYETHGPLFETAFKAVHVETDEQLLHLSRYHHLNPVTARLVEHPKDYPFSSYLQYLQKPFPPFDPSNVLAHFSNTAKYEEFVLSQKDYQRELDKVKHLLE